MANEKAPSDYRGRQGVIFGRGPGKTEYKVEFDGQISYLNSWWLDRVYEEPRNERL